jgi:putative aminopeptidase FrvX
MSFELLKTLCATPGVPGREEQFREVVRAEIAPSAESITTDAMGNLFALRKGKSATPRKIMIAGHMDEIAFVVKHITKDGFVYFHPLGGFDPRTLIAQRVKVYGTRTLDGVIAIKAAHFTTPEERGKVIPLNDLFIDLGLSGEEAKEVVSIGDCITMERELIKMGNFYTGKTLDDRVGVYVMLEVFRAFTESQDDIYAVATVQEEIGLRGAKTASFSLQPDIGIALDITIAADTPGVDEKDHCVKMGGGVGIKILDSSSICHPGLVRFLRELAERKGIKHQMEVLPAGGTDAGGIQLSRGGTPVCTLSIPCRYTHSVVESVHKDDVQATIDLLRAFIEHSHEFQF